MSNNGGAGTGHTGGPETPTEAGRPRVTGDTGAGTDPGTGSGRGQTGGIAGGAETEGHGIAGAPGSATGTGDAGAAETAPEVQGQAFRTPGLPATPATAQAETAQAQD